MRQTSVGQIVDTVGKMAEINRGEQAGELTEAQAAIARAKLPNVQKLDEAQLRQHAAETRRIEQEAVRLEQTNPYAAEALRAEIRVRNAAAGLTGAQERSVDEQTKARVALRDLERSKLEEDVALLKQRREQGIREHTITTENGEKVQVNLDEYLKAKEIELRSLGGAGGDKSPSVYQQEQMNRQRREDEQKDQLEKTKSEDIIKQNPKADTTAQHEIFNSRSNDPHVYVDRPQGITEKLNPFQPGGSRSQKIPLPKIKTSDGAEHQLTAKEVYREWRTKFSGMTFKQFLAHTYRNVAKQPVPSVLAE